MVALLGAYIYLNSDKINFAAGQYDMIIHAKPANELQIFSNDEMFAAFQVPSSDIIDAPGKRQITFYPLTTQQEVRLRNEHRKLVTRMNGENILARYIERPGYVILETPEHKLYLISENYTENMAAILENERLYRWGIIHCVDERLCRLFNVNFSEGWGPLKEPSLRSDIPRGRWTLGPVTRMQLVSRADVKVVATFYMLTPAPNQEVTIKGPVLARYQISLQNISSAPVDDIYYPQVFAVELLLRQGVNDIEIAYTQWLDSSSGNMLPLAAFVTGIEIGHVK